MMVGYLVGKKGLGKGATVTRQDLGAAKLALKRLDIVVGIFEHYADSVKLLARVFGEQHDVAEMLSCSNIVGVSAADLRTTPAQLELLRAHNALDMELYAFAKQLCRARWLSVYGRPYPLGGHVNTLRCGDPVEG